MFAKILKQENGSRQTLSDNEKTQKLKNQNQSDAITFAENRI